jgi:hypothetical protein
LKIKDLIPFNVLSLSLKLIAFISLNRHHKRHEGTIFHIASLPTSIKVDYSSGHNPR